MSRSFVVQCSPLSKCFCYAVASNYSFTKNIIKEPRLLFILDTGSKGIDFTSLSTHLFLLQVIKRPGDSGETPMIGDKVYVHYTGRLLNGKKFDSSHDRGEPFTFNLGIGQMIKAWDLAVASMSKGEVCEITCKPEYTYGVSWNPPKIPPNSTLVFELTEDGGIVRRIKQKGEGYASPNEGAVVDVHLEGSCAGHVFDSRDLRFIVGEAEDHDIPLGVDRAMKRMEKGECCLLYLSPRYGFGTEGHSHFGIGPNADLIYEVLLKEFVKVKNTWDMTMVEKLELAVAAKQKGTQYFKAGKYIQAVIQYQKIVPCLEIEENHSEEHQASVKALVLSSLLNLAMCHLRLQEYSHAVEKCNKVIEVDNSNEKALYRRGKAWLQMNEFYLAKSDFERVLEINTENKAAQAQISICLQKIREHHEREKQTYANMFQKFADQDTKIENVSTAKKNKQN
uniref:peptidylprolyl isomerase n=1 Tax=Erpetoichthys calabaricus TaxID=27687 RepID=A0A8C4XBR6_ERPCA